MDFTKKTATFTESDTPEIFSEKWPNVVASAKQGFKSFCSIEELHRKVPITKWLPAYKKSFIIPDIVAGVTVALTVIPQGIADSALAGLPPEYGLYAGFMGVFVYCVFGSVKDITIGPTALLSLLTYSIVQNLNADLAVFMTFVSGVIVFLCGFFNLGFLMQFISTPTITGFMNGASITIMSAQLKRLSGIKSGSTAQFADSWKTMFTYYDEIKWTDSLLGLTSLVLLLSIREIYRRNRSSEFLRYLSVTRNAIVVFGGILIAFLCQRNGNQPFNLVGEVKPGLPTFALPPFSTVFEGKTYNFKDMFSSLGLSLLSVPLVSIIELVAIAKSFSKGKVIDVTQELLALGLCNIGSSFFRSIPITGSFTRSAVNNASGVKTTLGGIFTGVLVLFALGVLSEAFYYIPRTSLAAVIIAAMLTLVEVRKVMEIYRTKRIEILIFLGTFLVSLWQGLEIGILVGVGINVLFTLYNTSRPVIDMSETMVNGRSVLLITPKQNIIYSSAEHFKVKVFFKVQKNPEIEIIVINGDGISFIDTTALDNITALIEDLKLVNKKILFWNWSREPYHAMMRYSQSYHDIFKRSKSLTELIDQVYNNSEKITRVDVES